MKKLNLAFVAASLLLLIACGNESTEKTTTETTVADTVVTAVEAPAESPAIKLVQQTLATEMKEYIDKGIIDSSSRKFKFSEYDLNDDGNKEIFAGLTGSFFCGTGGCTIYLLTDEGKVVTRFTVSDYPVMVADTKTNGWKDLIIYSHGNKLVKFNGKAYPSNPSVEPAFKGTVSDSLPRLLVWENTPFYNF